MYNIDNKYIIIQIFINLLIYTQMNYSRMYNQLVYVCKYCCTYLFVSAL